MRGDSVLGPRKVPHAWAFAPAGPHVHDDVAVAASDPRAAGHRAACRPAVPIDDIPELRFSSYRSGR